jgi:hypothetical protein
MIKDIKAKNVILKELKKTQISTAIELYNKFGLSDDQVLKKLDEQDRRIYGDHYPFLGTW